jgi:outer membrane cobalamin receptor
MKTQLLKLTLLVALGLISLVSFSQGVIKGKIVDSETNESLIGASIVQIGTTNGTTTNTNGEFSLAVDEGTQAIQISYIGYNTMKLNVKVSSGQTNDLGKLAIDASSIAIGELVVIGNGVIDIARDRETPVAVSTIKLTEIQTKSGNQEFPDVMKNTPSVYVASQAGGYGDSRINIRGFSQENLAVLFNGQPVNGMEDGKVYWSNWQGLTEIANAIQIQRGLGSSKLAISSVGATINVVTKATDLKEGGRASILMGNDQYQKYTASYSTGLNEKGWGMSILLSHWQGDGYNDGTNGQGQTYFISVGYKPSEKHSFNFSATGAPQWHYQNFTKALSAYDRDGNGDISNDEQRFNNNWGYYKGDVYSMRENFYHKPVANLNWDWKLDSKTALSTVFYGSVGQGGGTGPYGTSSSGIVDENGQVDFDQIEANNKAIDSSGEDFHIPGKTIGKFGTGTIRRSSMNMHRWLGAVTNFNHEINENFSYNVGADFRTYFGEHFRLVDNLWGLDGYWDDNFNGAGFQEMFPGGRVYTQEHEATPYMFWKDRNDIMDDKLDYHNNERISYSGIFGQLEYKNEIISAFVQGALSTQSYQRFDYHSYSDPDDQISEKLHHEGYNIKAGGNYNINEQHNVFINTGYYSRQPFFDDLFLNFLNDVNEDVGNEGVFGLEAGYGFRSSVLDVDFNAYYTKWSDRQIRQTGDFDGDLDRDDVALFENVAENHMGIEIELEARLTNDLTVNGFASIGDWTYAGNVDARIWDEDRNPIGGENTLYLDDVKVGDAAQTSFGILANYKIMKGLSVDADYRHYSNLYATIDPESFSDEDHMGSLELPSYGIFDAGASYRWYMKNNNVLKFRFNMNNVLNKQYISQSDTNIHPEAGEPTWEGINMDNRVYFGNGITWNASVSLSF